MLNRWEMASGKNLWHVETKKEFVPRKGFFGVACSPLVEGRGVI